MQNTHLVFDTISIEDALEQASRQWGVPSGDLDVEVVGEERGFLGLFGRKLKVQVTPKRSLLSLKSRVFLVDILKRMELQVVPELNAENSMITLEGQDAGILVGRYGDGLKALEYLLNLALRSPGDEPRIRLDSGGYRERRKQSLARLAEAAARKVVERGTPMRLEPMLSWERWVIHTTLKNRSDVETQSVGESPDRKVVIMPKLSFAERQESGGTRGRGGSKHRYKR